MENTTTKNAGFEIDPATLSQLAAPGRAVYGLLAAKQITLKAARNNPLYLNLSKSNKKLRPTKTEKWLIFNLPAVITCPNATALCIKFCYAKKAEKMYKSAAKRRALNYIDSLQADFIVRLIYTIYVNLYAAEKGGATLNIRIHESGDFYSRDYFEKWLTAAAEFSGRAVRFWTYTKSFDFIQTATEAAALNVRGSVWADTDKQDLEKIAALDMPIYTAYTAEEIAARRVAGEKFHLCRCNDCSTCRACPNGKIKKIIVEIH